jgi:hypothetical protein
MEQPNFFALERSVPGLLTRDSKSGNVIDRAYLISTKMNQSCPCLMVLNHGLSIFAPRFDPYVMENF